MKKSFEEKIHSKSKKFKEKHPKIGFLSGLYSRVVLFIYHLGIHFGTNGKRYASIGVFILIFAINSSFTFYKEEANADETILMDTQEIALSDVELLDDEDVIDGYEDAELHDIEDADKFTLEDILETGEDYKNTDTQVLTQKELEDYVFDKDDWRLILINKQHPIPDGYTFELETIKDGMQCDKRIISDLLNMMQGAKDDGATLIIRSPYRDLSRQEYLFGRKITLYMGRGMSYMDAYKLASTAVTVPGASEHQIGLALDITSETYLDLNEGFADTLEGQWLAEHSYEYGFILRYPKDKEYITSIEFEPWHFRYVGVEAATIIHNEGITLEEFWQECNFK